MISRCIHRNTCVGCGIRLLKKLLTIRLGYQKTIAKSLVIAVLPSTVIVASTLPPWSCFDCALK